MSHCDCLNEQNTVGVTLCGFDCDTLIAFCVVMLAFGTLKSPYEEVKGHKDRSIPTTVGNVWVFR